MKKLLSSLFLGIAIITTNAQQTSGSKRVLIISGGGARGAWGVGVVMKLIHDGGGYDAVYGTSTGSLTAPLSLIVKDTQLLADIYTNVTQKSIFSISPFHVHESHDPNGNPIVTTKLKGLNAIYRLIFGKQTLGTTNNLRKLIGDKFTKEDYIRIKDTNHQHLNVAVTNMISGHAEIKSSDSYSYNDMLDWIWASANEPVWMSYVKKDDSLYADGGIVEVIPVVEAFNYAFNGNPNIDTIDLIINNSSQGIDANWNPKGSWLNGLIRIVDILPNSVSNDDAKIAVLLTELNNAMAANRKNGASLIGDRTLVLRTYTMPEEIAVNYRDELGFYKDAMLHLLNLGRNYNTPISTTISLQTFRSVVDTSLTRSLHYQLKEYYK